MYMKGKEALDKSQPCSRKKNLKVERLNIRTTLKRAHEKIRRFHTAPLV